METHQRGKRIGRRRGSERVRKKERRETHRFPAEFSTHHKLGGSAVVALIKEQIESALDCWEPGGEVFDARDVEQSFRSRKHFLTARNALFDRGLTAEEGVRDFTHTEAA